MERLGPDAMLILWSAPARTYSLDIDYEYRQDSNLYYLTGLTQEETILVLMPGNVSPREFLFVKESDPAKEHWYGRVLSTAEASAFTGIRTVMTTGQFESFVDAALGRHEASRVALLLDLRPPRTRRPARLDTSGRNRRHRRGEFARRIRRPVLPACKRSTPRRSSRASGRSRRRTSGRCSSRAWRSRTTRRWSACARPGPAPTNTR